MTQPHVEGAVTPEERRLLSRVREIPAGPVRDELVDLMEELVEFVRDPRCPEAQADGTPCQSTALACEQCQMTASVLASLHRRLRRA